MVGSTQQTHFLFPLSNFLFNYDLFSPFAQGGEGVHVPVGHGDAALRKALILHEGRLLFNKCVSRLGVYYALPGGGQHEGELLTEAVKREVMEETGLTVEPMRLSAVFERVSGHEGSVKAHKMYFVFLCRYLPEVPAREPVERDAYQVGMD